MAGWTWRPRTAVALPTGSRGTARSRVAALLIGTLAPVARPPDAQCASHPLAERNARCGAEHQGAVGCGYSSISTESVMPHLSTIDLIVPSA